MYHNVASDVGTEPLQNRFADTWVVDSTVTFEHSRRWAIKNFGANEIKNFLKPFCEIDRKLLVLFAWLWLNINFWHQAANSSVRERRTVSRSYSLEIDIYF